MLYKKVYTLFSKNQITFAEAYLRGKNFAGKNFRRQKFSSLARNFVTFFRRKF